MLDANDRWEERWEGSGSTSASAIVCASPSRLLLDPDEPGLNGGEAGGTHSLPLGEERGLVLRLSDARRAASSYGLL